MKKLLTKLATTAMVATCMSVPISMDAKTVYVDTQGVEYTGGVYAYTWGSSNSNENYQNWSSLKSGEQIGKYIWKFDVGECTGVIFNKKQSGEDKLTGDCNVVDGNIYSADCIGNGIKYQLLIQANAVDVDWNQGKALTQDPSNSSVFTGEIEINGNGYFHFAHAVGNNNNKFSAYAPSSDTDVTAGNSINLNYNKTASANWKIPAGTYDVKVDLSANTFTFTTIATSGFENGDVIYFKPSSQWKEASAIFRAVFNDSSTASCTQLESDSEYYYFTVPKEGLTTVKIERGPNTNVWGWNTFTAELKSSDKNENNCIEITNTAYGGATVKWAVFTPTVPSDYNNTLYVGIASSNRHQIQPAAGGGYAEYKFYVNEEDLADGKLGFRFYSEPNGGAWMGGDEWTDIEYGTEYTTSGIKRYWINETGAYSIKVKSYDPAKNKVVFSIEKLEGDVVLEPLYIGGTWDNTFLPDNADATNKAVKTRIESQYGKYKPFEVTVPANSTFLFFSRQTDGAWMGAVNTDGIVVDSKGTLAYTTVGSNRKFKFVEAGTYEINVSEYIKESSKVTFTAKLISSSIVEAPATLYMRNSRDNWNSVVPMTYDAESQSFSANVSFSGSENFAFHFYENNSDNWADRGVIYYPDANANISDNSLVNIDHYNAIGEDPNKAWTFVNNATQDVTVTVRFGRGIPAVEVISQSPAKNYYFIGDLNDWYSNEFDGELGKTDNYGEEIKQGINKNKFEATKEQWQFEYVGDGWYRFTGFPDGLLTGHFQIVSEGSWSTGEIYSHVINFSYNENPNDNTLTEANYKAFKMNRITRQDILEGREYRVRKRDGGNGLNLGTQCSGVEDAELYFYPGNDVEVPRIKLVGTPKDYFIFYNMEEAQDFAPDYKTDADGNNNEYWVRAKINSGKPNTNNYFLAGIKYGDYTLPFFDINGNSGAHMNLNEGIDLAPYALRDLSEDELNDLFFGQEDIVSSILTDHRLPNGRDINPYDNVWVAKIPSGFENPAGTKYNMTFTKAMTEADRTSTRTITPRHLYFFPQQDGLHVHINTDEIEDLGKVAGVDVAYRVYKTDNNYNTITVLHGSDVLPDGRATQILHNVGSVLPRTAESDSKDLGWYTCEKRDKSDWGNPSVADHQDQEWYVSWIPETQQDEEVSPAAETESAVKDCRREVAYDDNSAFVQFRITIHLNEPIGVRASDGRAAAPISEYTVYVPERVDVANDEYHFSFDNNDLYVKTNAGENSDGVWTGLREVLDEIGGNVDPSSVKTVYYNLQGVRIDNPTEGGVYIRVRGNKSDKVLF